MTHELADDCYEAKMRFSFGYERTERVSTAILELRHGRARDASWSGDDTQRANRGAEQHL